MTSTRPPRAAARGAAPVTAISTGARPWPSVDASPVVGLRAPGATSWAERTYAPAGIVAAGARPRASDGACRTPGGRNLDGTRFTPPIPATDDEGKVIKDAPAVNAEKKKGEPGAITAPDAGLIGKGAGSHAGKGWQFIGLFSEHGTLLGWDISALHTGEREAAKRVLDSYAEEVLPCRDPKTISVCAADGGFSSPDLRTQMQELRIVPNIHNVSHGDSEESLRNAANQDANWRPFRHPSKPHYSNWQANGHREIACQCGAGGTERIFSVSPKTGKLTIATKGVCNTCGTVTITAGKWHRVGNPPRYELALAGAEADPTIGNSLTFNDPISSRYGRGRFGWGESVHVVLDRRFGLLKDRSWMRSKVEVETEFAIAASAISVLLLVRDARKQLAQPSGLAAAA